MPCCLPYGFLVAIQNRHIRGIIEVNYLHCRLTTTDVRNTQVVELKGRTLR